MPFVALLDASVLVPAALRDTLLRAAEAELYRPIWSAEILDEVETAQVIITQDLAHFPPAALELPGIDVQSPDEFLEHLFTLYPATMTHVIVEQAAALRWPPKTPIDVCSALQLHAPRFAGLVRRALGA